MSIFTAKHGMTNAEIEDLLFCLAQFINQSGVIATGDLLVEAQATPDMTVKVAVGRAVLKTSDGRNGYPVYNDASANVTISANASGVTKIDAIVLYWDGGVTADANASNVAKLTTVRGTASASPTDAEIQTAVGAGNPFLRLADVTVANGASSINSGNIADKRVYSDPAVRRTTAITDNVITGASGIAQSVTGSTNLTSASTTFVQIGTHQVTFTTTGTSSTVLVWVSGTGFAPGAAGSSFLGLQLDSGGVSGRLVPDNTSTAPIGYGLSAVFSGVAAGTHTVKLMWNNTNASTMTLKAFNDVFWTYVEMKK